MLKSWNYSNKIELKKIFRIFIILDHFHIEVATGAHCIQK